MASQVLNHIRDNRKNVPIAMASTSTANTIPSTINTTLSERRVDVSFLALTVAFLFDKTVPIVMSRTVLK